MMEQQIQIRRQLPLAAICDELDGLRRRRADTLANLVKEGDPEVDGIPAPRQGAGMAYESWWGAIGLVPLATGLTLRQLAGVLGHEMGHFAQGSAHAGREMKTVCRSASSCSTRLKSR